MDEERRRLTSLCNNCILYLISAASTINSWKSMMSYMTVGLLGALHSPEFEVELQRMRPQAWSRGSPRLRGCRSLCRKPPIFSHVYPFRNTNRPLEDRWLPRQSSKSGIDKLS